MNSGNPIPPEYIREINEWHIKEHEKRMAILRKHVYGVFITGDQAGLPPVTRDDLYVRD